MKLDAHGMTVTIPRGFSGRIFSRQDGAATLHVANYALALSDGQFGDRSTARMAHGALFMALTEYLPGAGLRPGHGLFRARHLPLPLEPSAFSVRGLAHPRPGQVGAQHFFTASGRALCLYIVLAGDRSGRRRQLAAADHVLRTLAVSPR